LKKFYPVCKLKIPECLADTGDTGLAGFSIKSEKSPKIPERRYYDSKIHGESGYSKFYSVCEIKIGRLVIGIG